MSTRSDMQDGESQSQPDAFLPRFLNSSSGTPSSPSQVSSLPSTPRRLSPTPHHSQPHSNSHSSAGLLTPSSSKASLSPALSRYKDQCRSPSPAFSQAQSIRSKHQPPNRRLFFPVRASLEVFTQTARCAALYMPENMGSRSGSPTRRSRAMSPKCPELSARPPSRCESLLRDTLRRDERGRTLAHRTMSRSPPRWTQGRSRPRGNSFLEALRRDDSPDSDCDVDDLIQRMNEREILGYRHRTQTMSMRGRGGMSASSTDVGSLPYGSPSSPSPMPPSMVRTRTAPSVPRVKGRACDDEQRVAVSRPPKSPQSGRRSLPNTVSHSHASTVPSSNVSPKQRMSTLSPHESVLRAKLEYVLQKAGSPSVEEPMVPVIRGQERRNHHRTFSHGVTLVTSPKQRDDPSPNSSSPQSLAPSPLSNSATDLARSNSTPSHRQNSFESRMSPASPPEPLTPPPTPPFNARTASEVCKRIDGYVSFASVEGLGEPPGLDVDSDESEEGIRRLGRWLRKLPVPFLNGAYGPSEQDGQPAAGRHRSGSTSGSR